MPTTVLSRLDPEQQALCLGARTTLDPVAAARLATLVAGGLDWSRLWRLGHLHEVIPLLAATIPTAATASGVTIPDGWLAAAQRRRAATLVQNARLVDVLGGLLDALRADDVPVIPVKGLVSAERWYGSLATRPAADIDILVRPEDLPRARATLREAGLTQSKVTTFTQRVHEYHDPAWIAEARGGGTIIVELHWALWSAGAHPQQLDGLWARARPGPILGREVLLLDPVDAALHFAIHRTRSALRLRWIVDMAELLRVEGPGFGWDQLVQRAGELRARTATWVLLGLARDLLDAPVPAGVLATLRPNPAKRAVLERTCGVTALFRPAADGSVGQQPHLTLRVLEQDGASRIARSLVRTARRTSRRVLHEHGIREVQARST